MEKLEFKEFKKKKHEPSSIWNDFLRTEDGTYAKCKQCNKVLKCQNTTSCLHNHLKTHRNEPSSSTSTVSVVPRKRGAQAQHDECEPSRKKSRIDDYFLPAEDDTMETMVSKMTACDGLPFSIFCTSDSIRKLFLKSGYNNLPKSSNTIKKIVVAKSDEIKGCLKKELATMKTEGHKFSVTLDEWTSDRNRRYINVNIHSPNFKDKTFKNLGLSRIKGSATAANCINILQSKLADYDLLMENDVACAVTDGASVMCSLGRQVPSYHQQCLAHGIQCGVIDAIYNRVESDVEEREDYMEQEHTVESTLETNTSGYEDSDSEEEANGFVVQPRCQPTIRSLIHHKDLIDKVRGVVKFFKKSSGRQDVLKKYLLEENKKQELILDCKTRWNSLASMVERFLSLKTAVMKALIDTKNTTTFSDEEFRILEDMSTSLNVVKTTVEAICQEKANLLTAEVALQFMINKLQSQAERSIFSRRLLNALKERINQRRQKELVCTLKYLHNPTTYYDEVLTHTHSSDTFLCVGNDVISNIIVDINRRYFNRNPQSNEFEDNLNRSETETEDALPPHQVVESIETVETLETEASLKKQLQKTIDMTISATPSTSTVNLPTNEEFETAIRMEMALFDSGGPRQLHLNQAYNFLLCIPPTSVECERVFSSTKYITNHLRCALRDDSIDALSFLRSHYQGSRKCRN